MPAQGFSDAKSRVNSTAGFVRLQESRIGGTFICATATMSVPLLKISEYFHRLYCQCESVLYQSMVMTRVRKMLAGQAIKRESDG
jgi:hypothetical protein